MTATRGRHWLVAAGLVVAMAIPATLGTGVANGVPAAPGSSDAYYSPKADLPQARSPQSLRRFLSNAQPQYTEQSYVWAGSLIEADGGLNSFGVEMQRNESVVGGVFKVPTVTAAMLFNQADDPGYLIGALGGLPDLTLPVNLTPVPWSARVQSFTPGQQPDFIDVRVVKGKFGTRGAVYEFTSNVPNLATGAHKGSRLNGYVRVTDVTGFMQWGYGPSGFAPMWVFDEQRKQIMRKFGGSVGDYLKATKDPMTSQGQYYYTLPLLKVDRFRMAIDGKVVSAGSAGWIWMDSVERSFDARAQEIVDNGVSWLEFSVQIPTTRQAMKIAWTYQASVGRFPYAYLASPGGPSAQNGAYTPEMTWDMDGIHIVPIKSSKWTNPVSGNTYYLDYEVKLDDSGTGERTRLVIRSAIPDQEAVVSGRSVFEGVFSVTGTIGDEQVSGWAFGEIQPIGTL